MVLLAIPQALNTPLSLSGRSISANMIDSKVMDALYDHTLDTLLNAVVRDFGLTVNSLIDASALESIEEFQINAESPVDNFTGCTKEQGVMLIERNGVLTIENPAHAALQGVRLEVGKSIESITINRNFTKQFYHIEVQGQWDDAHAIVTYARRIRSVKPSSYQTNYKVPLLVRLVQSTSAT